MMPEIFLSLTAVSILVGTFFSASRTIRGEKKRMDIEDLANFASRMEPLEENERKSRKLKDLTLELHGLDNEPKEKLSAEVRQLSSHLYETWDKNYTTFYYHRIKTAAYKEIEILSIYKNMIDGIIVDEANSLLSLRIRNKNVSIKVSQFAQMLLDGDIFTEKERIDVERERHNNEYLYTRTSITDTTQAATIDAYSSPVKEGRESLSYQSSIFLKALFKDKLTFNQIPRENIAELYSKLGKEYCEAFLPGFLSYAETVLSDTSPLFSTINGALMMNANNITHGELHEDGITCGEMFANYFGPTEIRTHLKAVQIHNDYAGYNNSYNEEGWHLSKGIPEKRSPSFSKALTLDEMQYLLYSNLSNVVLFHKYISLFSGKLLYKSNSSDYLFEINHRKTYGDTKIFYSFDFKTEVNILNYPYVSFEKLSAQFASGEISAFVSYEDKDVFRIPEEKEKLFSSMKTLNDFYEYCENEQRFFSESFLKMSGGHTNVTFSKVEPFGGERVYILGKIYDFDLKITFCTQSLGSLRPSTLYFSANQFYDGVLNDSIY